MYRFGIKFLLITICCCYLLSCTNKHEQHNKQDSTTIAVQPTVSIECDYKNLSKEFDLKLFFNRYKTTTVNDSCIVRLIISDKIDHHVIDTLLLTSIYYYDNVFKDCNHVLSYSTKVDFKGVGDDNDYGNIVIADLNFDNKEDIAVINDSGGNGGVFYNYYLQENQKFVLDKYLTDSMTYFPTKINKANRTLITYVHANAYQLAEHVYYFNNKTNNWIEKSQKFIPPIKQP
ncbi:XAC2610-related protein [Emticicia agri]|uniref:Uncharacterized protein n=1 Tax=Emticicia agri TaxID=2492393 RepID=A0A4Q5LTL9_9BACT|nr:hypothetical protein [Emticicia agri]RYU92968.1 hypothetical protein EWM59_24445 [Emticicia agri]